MLIEYPDKKSGTISSDVDTINKAVELINLFSDVSIDVITSMLTLDAGKLAYAVLCNQGDTVPVRALMEEISLEILSSETAKPYVTRQALMNELEDILKATTITPYRRSRINKALKRECIACHGSGKAPSKKLINRGNLGTPKRVRHEISINSPDCIHCRGTGIKDAPKEGKITTITEDDIVSDEEIKTIANLKLTD